MPLGEAQPGEATATTDADLFRSLLEQCRDVIYRVNLTTEKYDYISPSAQSVVGFSAEELMALEPGASLDMVHPGDRCTFQAAMERAVATGTAVVEYRQRTSDGRFRWLSNQMT